MRKSKTRNFIFSNSRCSSFIKLLSKYETLNFKFNLKNHENLKFMKTLTLDEKIQSQMNFKSKSYKLVSKKAHRFSSQKVFLKKIFSNNWVTYVYKPFDEWLVWLNHDNSLPDNSGSDDLPCCVDTWGKLHPTCDPTICTIPYWNDIFEHEDYNCKLKEKKKKFHENNDQSNWKFQDE